MIETTAANKKIEQFWQAYLATLPANSLVRSERYVARRFGDRPDLANYRGALIVNRTKTATCSALWEWEAEGEPIPEVGRKTIVLNGNDEPLCIIETTEVTLQPYNQVDAQFAYDAGEGNRSLDYWREVHWRYFLRALVAIDLEPAEDMPLVCERFWVVYEK